MCVGGWVGGRRGGGGGGGRVARWDAWWELNCFLLDRNLSSYSDAAPN